MILIPFEVWEKNKGVSHQPSSVRQNHKTIKLKKTNPFKKAKSLPNQFYKVWKTG